MITLPYVFSSIKGKDRKQNWDDLLVVNNDNYDIFVVFDGVSSSPNGKKAAVMAKNFIRDHCNKNENTIPDLQKLMYQVHLNLLEPKISQPYTTYCSVLYDRHSYRCHYSWLGDSRIYLFSETLMKMLTSDDSASEHVITKCLGQLNLTLADFRQVEVNIKGAKLLLCTDGFYRINKSGNQSFLQYLNEQSLPALKNSFESLIRGNNSDDATFIIIQF